jgi:spore cortex formation protein SpoVR/YcgB (stage V sporulation)
METPLFTGTEWDFDTLDRTWKVIDDIGRNQLGVDYYEPQFEIISSEQMLDCYSSHAMPAMYNHWSFGKSFIQNEHGYKTGQSGLAYEVVINTNPSIAYLMENNSMTMQALVMAHASVGHSGFFKSNYLFREWSDADSILDYLKYAKNYIIKCEEKYGATQVEELLDACHSLQRHGVDKYKRPHIKAEVERQKKREYDKYLEQHFNDLWRTVPESEEEKIPEEEQTDKVFPEENILYFLEKHSPVLKDWQREILRIVRKISQYFYPQMQTQLMNEGFASFTHHTIMNMMWEQNHITSGSYIEFIKSHAGVVAQPDWDHKYYSGINVYALGFAMMKDIQRICTAPDDEDRRYFPSICDTDWKRTILDVVQNYRDESFVTQFLSPKILRKFKLFALTMDEEKDYYQVGLTHDDDHLLAVRKALSAQYDLSKRVPQIEVTSVDWNGDRVLHLTHFVQQDRLLSHKDAKKTAAYIHQLWGHQVRIHYVDETGEEI